VWQVWQVWQKQRKRTADAGWREFTGRLGLLPRQRLVVWSSASGRAKRNWV